MAALIFQALSCSNTLFANDHSPGLLSELNGGNRSVAPAGFEENKGQVTTTTGVPAPEVRFRYTQGGTTLFLLRTGIAYQFNRLHRPVGLDELEEEARFDPTKRMQHDALRAETRVESYRMDMLLEGADPDARVSTEGRSTDYTQYYTHDVLDVHTYRRITYHEVYPGIDWVLYTTEEGIKYDFVVRPGADPARIMLRFLHHEELRVEADGCLTHGNRLGRFTEAAPVSYQNGHSVGTRFVLQEDHQRPGQALVHFDLDPYDRSSTLRIDPARIWGTYYGGSGFDYGYSCAVDGGGNVLLAGETHSPNAISSGGHQLIAGSVVDGFLVKFDGSGNRLWGTYYGGESWDSGKSCAVDAVGNVFLAGYTASLNTVASAGHQNSIGGNNDAYLVKFNGAGIRQWSTYYGGPGDDIGYSCAVDLSGEVYLSGYTESSSAIASGGHQNTFGGLRDAFLVKFSASGIRLWGTYYGGSAFEDSYACSVNNSAQVYLVGVTESTADIASGGHQNVFGGGLVDAFIVKFDATGARQWASYYGGPGDDGGVACAFDVDGSAYMVGATTSATDIASGGHQGFLAGDWDGFVVKFDGTGIREWGTYYGGIEEERALSCAVDDNGNLYVAGTTESATGIDSLGFQNVFGGGIDAFLVKFSSTGARSWGTYYGDTGLNRGFSCSTDGSGSVYVAGSTFSSTALASGGHQDTNGGGLDAFLVKFQGGTGVGIGEVGSVSIDVYPNPGVGLFTVRLEQPPGPGVRYRVLNAAGTTVLAGRLTQQVATIDMIVQSTGVYVLQLLTADGVRSAPLIRY
ncbi:MAG: SBBP repeat-containing protein [Flavobacteriales bacterium]|nr:SBBP repeat-containing protein [Flavobacteriales bacterium]